MPDLPIDQLPSASALQPTNVFPVVQSNVTKQAPYSFILYAPTNNYGLFNQTGSSTPVVNTTSELSLIGGGVGTLTVPANSFTQGDAYNAIIGGNVSAQNNNNLRIQIKAGSAILVDTGNISMASTTNSNFKLNIYFSIHNTGTAGVADIATTGNFMYTKDASTDFQGVNFSTINSTTFNTTINNTLSVTAKWGTADVDNSIYSELFTLNKTF